jgi:hypothetical protein
VARIAWLNLAISTLSIYRLGIIIPARMVSSGPEFEPKQDKSSNSDNPQQEEDRCNSIVGQILNLKGNLTNNILRILEEIGRQQRGTVDRHVMMALRRYFKSNGKITTDLCFMGIADQFFEKEFKPGDFVMYSYVQKIRRDDTVIILSSKNANDERNNEMSFRKISEVLPDNKVQIESESGGIGRIISKDDILAKIARVVPFASKEWNEIATEIAYKVQLQQILIDAGKEIALDAGQKREIEKRIAYLNR